MNIFGVGTLSLLLLSGAIGRMPLSLRPEASAGGSRFSLLPVFESDSGEFIGLSLTNTAPVVNEATVTWTNPDGNVTRTGFLSLPPGSQRTALVREIIGMPEDPSEGWIRIDSSEPGLLGYTTTGREGILDATEPATMISTSILLPHVAINTGFMELEHTDTLATLINPGPVPINARIGLVSLDGLPSGELTVTIPVCGSRTLRVSEVFRSVLPDNHVGGRTFQGYMRVLADGGLAGWLRVDTPLSRRLQRGRALEEVIPARQVMVSHFAFGSTVLYRSELNLINAGNAAVNLELAAQDNRGARIGQAVRRTLNPGQALREDVLSLFKVAIPAIFPPLLLDGYIRIRAADGGMLQLIGDIGITSKESAASMLYPVGPASSVDAILPFVINDGDYFTGYAIANPNEMLTVQTDITIELLDRDGRPVGAPRSVSLSPSARFISLVDEKVRSGYVRIRANLPFAALGCIGTRSVSALAPLPALP